MTAQKIIEKLQLVPHPEGGFFGETYRSKETFSENDTNEFPASRSHSTAIYFLLRGGDFSSLHRIKSDEVWHFYYGSPLIVHIIDQKRNYNPIHLGGSLDENQHFQAVVSAGDWFGAALESNNPNDFALVGCTVAPGFDFRDFEMPSRRELLQLFPEHKEVIELLTKA